MFVTSITAAYLGVMLQLWRRLYYRPYFIVFVNITRLLVISIHVVECYES